MTHRTVAAPGTSDGHWNDDLAATMTSDDTSTFASDPTAAPLYWDLIVHDPEPVSETDDVKVEAPPALLNLNPVNGTDESANVAAAENAAASLALPDGLSNASTAVMVH